MNYDEDDHDETVLSRDKVSVIARLNAHLENQQTIRPKQVAKEIKKTPKWVRAKLRVLMLYDHLRCQPWYLSHGEAEELIDEMI